MVIFEGGPNTDYNPLNPFHAVALRDNKTGSTWPLGAVMYRLRVNRDLSLRDVTTALVKPPRWLGDIEHGRGMPTVSEFYEWAKVVRFPEGCTEPIVIGLKAYWEKMGSPVLSPAPRSGSDDSLTKAEAN